jgi:hypothetical protein
LAEVAALEHDPDLHLESNRLHFLPAALVANQDFGIRRTEGRKNSLHVSLKAETH